MPTTARTWIAGFAAVVERLDGEESSQPPGKLLLTAGSTLVSTVGGASGPLWGTALRRAGRALGEAEEFGAEELVAALDAALAGVVELGAAERGREDHGRRACAGGEGVPRARSGTAPASPTRSQPPVRPGRLECARPCRSRR